MLLLFKQQIQELFDYGKEQFFQKNVMYIPLAGGGGGTPGNSSWGCVARFFKSWPNFRPKNAIFRLDL